MNVKINEYRLKAETENKAGIESFFSPLSLDNFRLQYEEIFVKEEYKQGLRKKDMIVLDVGANMGLSILYFQKHAKMIYGMEPSSAHYAALEKNVGHLKNVKIFNEGISGHSGLDVLNSNFTGEIPESIYGDGAIREQIKVVTIDQLFDREGIDHVDVMKIDCEGAEYEILTSPGFAKVADKIDFVIGEGHYMGHCDPRILPLIFKDLGFTYKLLPIKNCVRSIHNTATGKEYVIILQTLFVAERKHE